MRVRGKPSERNLPESHNPETLRPDPVRSRALLSLRAAVIFGSSLAIAVAWGTLMYPSGPRPAAGMSAAAIFMAAVKLLDAIIAD
jgi:hypothetical protein